MKEASYKAMLEGISSRPKLSSAVLFVSKFATYFMYLFYPAFLVFLLVWDKKLPIKETLVPLIGFLALSLFRRLLNAPRPYENFDIEPINKKLTKGVSFPSRHTFSAFVIAFCAFSRFPIIGSALLILSAALGACRILSGVHFIKDVIAGTLFAIVCAPFFYIF